MAAADRIVRGTLHVQPTFRGMQLSIVQDKRSTSDFYNLTHD
jgi:hypothetical protein